MTNNTPQFTVATRRLIVLTILSALLAALFVWAPASRAQESTGPAAPPDSLTGLDVYSLRCANCHGDAGQGDGALILQMGGQPPRPFDETYSRTAQPQAMFSQITNGNLEVGMPPFGPASSNPIDEASRWDLVAAVYSLATPPDNITAGQTIYQTQCAACHGDTGQGNGPDAGTDPAPTDLTSINYWFNRSNQTVFNALAPGAVAGHDYDLGEDDLWHVVDYSRTFSYAYTNQAALNAPIPAGTIIGVLSNGTNGEVLGNTEVVLRAFAPDFTQTLALTTTTGTDGAFQFNVTDVSPDWVFMAAAGYEGLSFSSNAAQMGREIAALDLPITVFEQTSDASTISLAQLHLVMEFVEDQLEISELYIINNDASTVFVGPTGNPDEGTIEIALPAGAQNLSVQRSFGSLNNFLPANDFVQTERGWADPLPVRPGPNALTLLVRYTLPYQSGMTVAHPVYYSSPTSTIIMPDVGVEVVDEPWVAQPPQSFGEGETFLNYSRPALTAGEAIAFQLEGRPRVVAGTDGLVTTNRNTNTELILSGAGLLLTAVGGVLLWRYWQMRRDETDEEWEAEVEAATAVPRAAAATQEQQFTVKMKDADPKVPRPEAATQEQLLQAIADLDDAFDSGQIEEAVYQKQRAELKEQLAAIWL